MRCHLNKKFLAMDNQSYKVNECAVLIYLMEASMKATKSLYNGRLYHMNVIEKKTTGVLGLEGEQN